MSQPMLRRGSRGEDVRRLQRALADAGFSPGPVDGEFGPNTDAAVRRFQRSRGLETDGVVGPATWAKLLGTPRPGRGLSDRGVEFIARFEGLRLRLYNDPAGHCTIGYGHLVHRGPRNGSEPAEFKAGITKERALQLLRADAAGASAAVRSGVDVALNQHQFDALVSFAFNVGAGAFRGSTLRRQLNAGRYDQVPHQLRRWVSANGRRLPGLVNRRELEAQLFMSGLYSRSS